MLSTYFKTALILVALATPRVVLAQIDESQIIEASSAILDAGKTAIAVRGLHAAPSVGVIRVDRGFASPFSHFGEEIATLKIYEERNAGGITRLRHALAANVVTLRALASHEVNVNQVVGVSIGGSGSLRIFID